MKMILAEGVETRDIFRLAAERQVRIRRMNFRRDSLEDIFLKAMSGNTDATVNAFQGNSQITRAQTNGAMNGRL